MWGDQISDSIAELSDGRCFFFFKLTASSTGFKLDHELKKKGVRGKAKFRLKLTPFGSLLFFRHIFAQSSLAKLRFSWYIACVIYTILVTLIGYNLVLSAGLIKWIGHRKEIRIFYSGQFTLSTQLLKPNYLLILHTGATQQFNLAP